MATSRILGASRPRGLHPSSINTTLSSTTKVIKCLSSGEKHSNMCFPHESHNYYKPRVVAVNTSVATTPSLITTEPQSDRGVDLASLLANVTDTALMISKVVTRRRAWKLLIQMLVEKVIIDCRFFTWFAVAGSLLGSALCFLEGCFTILESYFQYFHTLSQRSDQGHVMQLLIEAIDMFMVGAAMLVFGMGLHVMFVGSTHLKGKGSQLSGSNFFGLFYLKTLPQWAGMESVSQAKSRIGHAVMMILQVGVVEKFKSVPLVTGLDLACFAGSILFSSASIFILSKLSDPAGDPKSQEVVTKNDCQMMSSC